MDHTVLDKIHGMANEWPPERQLVIMGLENHDAMSAHEHSARIRRAVEA